MSVASFVGLAPAASEARREGFSGSGRPALPADAECGFISLLWDTEWAVWQHYVDGSAGDIAFHVTDNFTLTIYFPLMMFSFHYRVIKMQDVSVTKDQNISILSRISLDSSRGVEYYAQPCKRNLPMANWKPDERRLRRMCGTWRVKRRDASSASKT